MGKNDSTKTRVAPVFDQLYKIDSTGSSWLPQLINLPIGGKTASLQPNCRFAIKDCRWGTNEKKLEPPVTLLAWLICHPRKPVSGKLKLSNDPVKADKRRQWIEGSQEIIDEGLGLLKHNSNNKNWYIFEGPTRPDVFIETDDLIVVIEGKRTEIKPTTITKWMGHRNQMLRHLDCAWEIKGHKYLLGFFIVEGNGFSADIPSKWITFAADTVSSATINASLPHRSIEEQQGIASCFIGVTTWQQVCMKFGIDYSKLS